MCVVCLVECILCTNYRKELDSFLRVHLDGVNTQKKRSGRPDDTLTAVCSTAILPTANTRYSSSRLGPEPLLPYLRGTQQTPKRNVIPGCDNADIGAKIQLNHAVLAFFSHPGAMTPMGAITPMGALARMITIYFIQLKSLDYFVWFDGTLLSYIVTTLLNMYTTFVFCFVMFGGPAWRLM